LSKTIETNVTATLLGIAEVERETGVSKDQLRVWERRYGFPSPPRNPYGERRYSHAEVAKLRLVRRLMDRGMRPGRLMGLTSEALEALAIEGMEVERSVLQDLALYLLKTHQTAQLRRELAQTLMRDGLFRFVTETAAPLVSMVGQAWMRGELRVFEEHLFTEILQGLLRGGIGQGAGPGGAPRILLTTLPQEQHALGVLMVEALCTLEGADCVALGPQTPVGDIAAAAAAKDVDIVALSFSSNFSALQVSEGLEALRSGLAASVELWCGGAGAARAKRIPEGVRCLTGLEDIGPAINQWRTTGKGQAAGGA